MKATMYRFWQTILIGTGLLLWSLNAQAQDSRVTGKVSGPDGPIPGANVLLKGTATGTSTDAAGTFSIAVRGANPVLVISSIGTKTQEVPVGNRSTINVTLEDDATALNEVIVTGYTTDSRKDNTGAVSTVKARDITATPTGNVEQVFQGRVSGVTVISSGQPGTNSIVRIRGFGSFGNNQPLYVVDGVPVSDQFNGINFLSPDDIESTTVLKDAATASIYGARAAGGVIVITTKRGNRKAGKLTVTYDGLFGITTPGHGQKMLNPQQQADWTWQSRRNDIFEAGGTVGPDSFTGLGGGQYGAGQTPVLPDYLNVGGTPGVVGTIDLVAAKALYNINPAAGPIYQVVRANKVGDGTDWYGAVTRNAPLARNTLGISGGSEHSRFYFGFSAQNQAGVLKYNQFNRYTFRVNSEFDLLKNLRLGQNLQLTYRQQLGQVGNTNGQSTPQDENVILQAFQINPIIPIYDEFGGYAGTAAKGFNGSQNPVATLDGIRNNRSFLASAFGNVYLEYDPIPGLTLRSSLGGQYGNFFSNAYNRATYETAQNNSTFSYTENYGYSLNWTLSNTANYKRQFGLHSVDVLAGQEALNTGSGRNATGSGINPFSTNPNYVTLSSTSGTGRQLGGNYGLGINFYSLFGRLQYTYNDKYTLTGVVRRDGSSRFGANSRYGVFPAVSAGWTISNESFLKNVPGISYLRLHAGYGTMGNSNNVDPNNQFNLYTQSINRSYDIATTKNSVASGFARSQIGNPDARWETAVTTDIGLDASLFNGKLDVQFDIWRKDTRDLLFQVPLPAVVGDNANAPAVNIAKMRNQGIDLQLTNRGTISRDLRYEVIVNGSFLSNVVQALAPGVSNFQPANFRNISPIQIQPDLPIAAFYGYKVLGLFNSKEEVAAAPTQDGAGPGRFRYADVNGDKKIDAADRTYLGSPVPKFTGGLTFTLRYKGFDMSTYAYTSLGGKIYNFSKWYIDFYPSFTGQAVSARVLNSWTPQNTNTDQPIFENTSNFSTNTQSNSFYVENGSYLRLQNLTLGYTLPPSLLDKAHIQRLRIFVQTTNLFTISKYKGLDPGVGGTADTNFGIDIGNYPVTRGFNAGIGFTF